MVYQCKHLELEGERLVQTTSLPRQNDLHTEEPLTLLNLNDKHSLNLTCNTIMSSRLDYMFYLARNYPFPSAYGC